MPADAVLLTNQKRRKRQRMLKDKSTNFTQYGVLTGTAAFVKKKSIKRFVSPEEAKCNLIGIVSNKQWLHSIVGNVGIRF